MRVCIISREYPPETGFGGIATFSNHLANGLKELGHDVEVVALAKETARSIVQDGIRVHRVLPTKIPGDLGCVAFGMPSSRYVLQTSTALWEKFFELHNERPFDIVDTPELLAEGLVPAVTKATPLVVRLYTPHSKFIAEGLHNITATFDHQFVAMLERVAMVSADAITSPSDDLADFVAQDLSYPRAEIRIVRNPIDPAEFSPEGNNAIEPDGRLTVLFVGRLEERKGIRYLIDAVPKVVAKFPNVRFVIIGDDTNNGKGHKSVRAELNQQIAQNGCSAHLMFIPRISLKELPAHYRSADICVVPSVYDNSPYTSLEAMSCGRPVIGTSSGGTKEYVIHEECGLIVPPKDGDALAEAILRLLENNAERAAMGCAARQRTLDKFQRTEIARQTVEVYELASRRFVARHAHRMYLKDPAEALHDAKLFLLAYDKMLYSMLYLKSYRFRIKHWWTLITRRPRLSAAKAVLVASRLFFRGRPPANVQSFVSKLESDVKVSQHEGEMLALMAKSRN
jgi:glycosyltransferase involved in cell wall biosynthesis